MSWVVPDFETSSAVDLKKAGAWRYAEDPTTEILVLCWCHGDDEIRRWYPWEPLPADLLALIEDDAVFFIAHNADFEKAIWRRIMGPVYGAPDIPNRRWHDTAARCANLTLPRGLDKALKILKLPVEKDMEGNRFTLSFSRANRKTGALPRYTPAAAERVGTYCEGDVRGQRELHKRIGSLPADERITYLLDQEINERGLRLDTDLIASMQKIVADASGPLAEEFEALTGGLRFTQRDKIMSWLLDRGVSLPDMRKETLDQIFGETDDGDDIEVDPGAYRPELPPDVDRALRIRRLIGSASIKKLDAMQACVCEDGRARGLLLYHGAGPGRWSGRLIQPQNFPRGSVIEDDREVLVEALRTGDAGYVECLYGPPVEAVVSSLRHTIIADPDCALLAGDYSGIEARVVLALAGQYDKCALLASGADVYIDMALDIYDMERFDIRDKSKILWFKEYHLEKRQVGKNTILGCGFQMGPPKFHDRYCPEQPIEFAEKVISTYRTVWAPLVPKLWYALEDAAVRTVWDRNAHEAYGILYQLEDDFLTARLPSGRKLWYYHPQKTRRAMPWDPDTLKRGFSFLQQKNGHTVTTDAYGGLLTENVVQAIARDLLRYAMLSCRREGLPIVLTVHDEIVLELAQRLADVRVLDQIMRDAPPWARALQVPIDVECWQGPRYRK